jgi:hypothetical protein
MLKIHIIKAKNKILITEFDFAQLLNLASKSDQIEIQTDEFQDLLEASSSSMDFGDNEIDDEVWNNA